MAQLPKHVQSGDVITAEMWNLVVDNLKDLDDRLSLVGTGPGTNGPPILINRWPTGDVEVGSLLTLNGRNFLRPKELNTVTLGTVPINQFSNNSDESTLTFVIPDIYGNLPRTVPVSVSHQYGTSTPLQVKLLSHTQTQGGTVVIFDQTLPLGQIDVGATYQLKWLVDSQTLLPATYNFSIVFSNVVGASLTSWQAGLQLSPTGPREIRRGTPLTVTANVTVPTGATSAEVRLKAESMDRSFVGSSGTINLTVGQTPAVSDPRVLLSVPGVPPFNSSGQANPARKATIDGDPSGIEVGFGQTGEVPITIHVINDPTAAGTYRFSAVVENASGLWANPIITPSSSGMTAPSDRDISLALQNTDSQNPHSTEVKYTVVYATHRTAAGADDFVSFVRFPIRGI